MTPGRNHEPTQTNSITSINRVDGLLRELAAGVTTRIFSGEQAMLSVVTLGAACRREPCITTPRSNGACCWTAQPFGSRAARKSRSRRAISGARPAMCRIRCAPDREGARVLDIFSPPRPEYKKPGAGFGTT